MVDPLAPASAPVDARRLARLQLAGIASGFTAGAWLGAAEAPTKMVTLGLSPVVISLAMVLGVFLARWSLSNGSIPFVRTMISTIFQAGRSRVLQC